MKPYADSNFFTRFYLTLPDSRLATALLEGARRETETPLPITWLHRLEVLNALELHVFGGRIQGHPRVTPEQAASAQASFREDLNRTDFLRVTQLLQEKLFGKFEELSLRHTAHLGFRVYDLIHVASALLLECDTFWSFDAKASHLAQLEGLRIRQS
jgi:predicted nucleic acid-binding protein